jgi:ParB/RepB/Spo0J family partition protein
MQRLMAQVDQLQNAEEHVAQMREEAARAQREAREAELKKAPLADTAGHAHTVVTAPLSRVKTMVNMRIGPLPEVHELAVSIKETGLLHPPLVRATGDEERPYELLAGRRRFAAMQLIDAADGTRDDWRFTLIDGVSTREALTMQFAENFHQSKPEPIQFARAARAIMNEDPSLTAADVSRLVGAPPAWTRKALKMLDLPDSIVARVEKGDLSFTVADLVRRGIERGDVSAEKAEDLVEQHGEGRITGGALKLGVGYVPPKPKDYDELSRKLDEARWAASRPDRIGEDGVEAEQREWEANDRAERAAVGGSAPAPAPVSARRADDEPALPPDDLDAYALALLLARAAPAEHRAALGIRDAETAHRYAFSIRPQERLAALRALAAELLAADPSPPRALRGQLAA